MFNVLYTCNYFQCSVKMSIFCSDAPKIFEKVVIHINGYTGDLKILHVSAVLKQVAETYM